MFKHILNFPGKKANIDFYKKGFLFLFFMHHMFCDFLRKSVLPKILFYDLMKIETVTIFIMHNKFKLKINKTLFLLRLSGKISGSQKSACIQIYIQIDSNGY